MIDPSDSFNYNGMKIGKYGKLFMRYHLVNWFVFRNDNHFIKFHSVSKWFNGALFHRLYIHCILFVLRNVSVKR